jgi:hypothetical protein
MDVPFRKIFFRIKVITFSDWSLPGMVVTSSVLPRLIAAGYCGNGILFQKVPGYHFILKIVFTPWLNKNPWVPLSSLNQKLYSHTTKTKFTNPYPSH